VLLRYDAHVCPSFSSCHELELLQVLDLPFVPPTPHPDFAPPGSESSSGLVGLHTVKVLPFGDYHRIGSVLEHCNLRPAVDKGRGQQELEIEQEEADFSNLGHRLALLEQGNGITGSRTSC
jgi:hypothetical protein